MLIRPLSMLALATALAAGAAAGQTVAGPELAKGSYKDYRQWARLNDPPIFSATHGNAFVVTYVNPVGLPAARAGKFPFPVGTVIVKEAFENSGCKPGRRSAVFVMTKREKGTDPAGNDWWWARYNSDGTLWGEGTGGGPTEFCRACHSVARINDFVFGNGTTMKVTPTMPPTACER